VYPHFSLISGHEGFDCAILHCRIAIAPTAQRPLLGIKRTWRGLVSMSANSTEVIRSAAAGPWSLALPSGLALLAFAMGLAEKPPL
jgi:hypothetical protein